MSCPLVLWLRRPLQRCHRRSLRPALRARLVAGDAWALLQPRVVQHKLRPIGGLRQSVAGAVLGPAGGCTATMEAPLAQHSRDRRRVSCGLLRGRGVRGVLVVAEPTPDRPSPAGEACAEGSHCCLRSLIQIMKARNAISTTTLTALSLIASSAESRHGPDGGSSADSRGLPRP